jgi:hypothetical protein
MQNNLNRLCFISCAENFIQKKTVKTVLRVFSARVWLSIKCISPNPSGFMCSRGNVYPVTRLHVLQGIHVPPVEYYPPAWGCHRGGMMSSAFWDVTPCSPLKVYRRFGGKYCLHFEGWRITQARKPPWSRQQTKPCLLILKRLHGVISQKIELFPYLVLFIYFYVLHYFLRLNISVNQIRRF